jgi:hypothetical protein
MAVQSGLGCVELEPGQHLQLPADGFTLGVTRAFLVAFQGHLSSRKAEPMNVWCRGLITTSFAVCVAGCGRIGRSCEVRWRLGDIDARFQIDAYDVSNAAFNAADAWNRAAGRRVLIFDKERGIPLRLVYADDTANLASGLAELRELRKLDIAITDLKRQFGANPSDYIVNRINTHIVRYNKLVESLNTRARNDIKQGSFQTELQIYAFADAADLQLVIAHEFGHALGIGHVADANAVMSARQQVGTAAVQLSATDAAALLEQCH